ncbi:MAG TPA: glycosyltransferase family 4 protein [Candidatus Hydrogenedentes bacterium]|nr:glycosyltransferase family 4 protein [Candidatus Hydrogenedentota bacterium]
MKLRVLITDPHMKGGGQVRYVRNLTEQLVRLGHEVIIGCKPGSILVDTAKHTGAEVIDSFVFRGGLRLGSWVSDVLTMSGALRKFRPDVIHANGSQDHWISAMTNRLMGSPFPVIRTRHNTYPVAVSFPNRILNKNWTTLQIVVCDIVRKKLAVHDCFDGNRLITIHNGVDAGIFAPRITVREEARREFGYEPHHLVVGIVARLVPAKGHAILFRAVQPLIKEFPFLRILVLGEGILRMELESLVKELDVGDTVHFAGYRTDMERVIQAVDIGVQPSIDCDTSSFSLKELMACGVPVIASNYGGLPEILTDGEEGFIVAAGQVEPLREAIQRLVQDPDLRRRMGEAGRNRVLQEFTVECFAERTLEAYEKALQIHRDQHPGVLSDDLA